MSSNIDRRVLTALSEAKEKLAKIEQQKSESIAIIGIAGRFPGANNIEEYWHNLQQGINSIKFLSDTELQTSGVSQELIKNPNYVPAYSSFDAPELFAADFFGYSPLEAEIIDPQHRIFLESAWTALENAGYDSDRYHGKIGVFAGSALNTYLLNLNSSSQLQKKLNNVQVVISNVMGLMPTRVSYKLNLKGASCGIQTGCSTSLVAVHVACQSLLNGESDMALAGGITVNTEGKKGYLYQEGSIASPDGYCRAFDAEGEGTVFGNGVGIVVLKRLSAAIKDRDNIWAIIKGSAINNDGADKVSLTAPSLTGQAEAIDLALKQAKIAPETITYIEAHGTGTALGDPIELAALNKVFRQGNYKQNSCAIGSVKTNFGHLDAAAGIAGLIKTVLSLHHKQIPPSLNFQRANTEIDFEGSPFYVNTQLTEWETNGNPRRAGVSSFGMGGTNAHVVLEEQREQGKQREQREQREHLLVLSAKTETALEKATVNLADYLRDNPELDLTSVAYTLQVGRKAFDYRRAIVCQETKDAIDKLTTSTITQHQLEIDRPITFMFSGQGSQYINMGRELYETQPIFKANCDRCFQILEQYLDVPLKEILFPPSADSADSAPSAQINQTQYAQPAIFTIEYALAQLWISWGIKPANAIGHSIGEYVAATIAGVFSLEAALKIVAKRGQLMQQCSSGAMLSVAMSADDALSLIGASPDLSLAVINAPELSVISGTEKAIDKLATELPQKGIACRRLHTSHGFHSVMMEEILGKFTAEFNHITIHPPQLPFISNVTGTWITAAQATNPDYWARHIRETVCFSPGIEAILQTPTRILLEIGGGKTLATLAKQHQHQISSDTICLTSLRHPKEEITDTEFVLNTLAKLWLARVKINWDNFYHDRTPYRIPLPTYPFERQRYWLDRLSLKSDSITTTPEVKPSPLIKKPDIQDWFYLPSWQRSQPLTHKEIDISEKYTCLIFCYPNSFSTEIVARLQQLNCDVITVNLTDLDNNCCDVGKNNNCYDVNPHNPDDYIALIDRLRETGRLPQKIIYLWGLSDTVSAMGEQQAREFNHLIYLTQALTAKHLTTPVQLSLITNNIQQVTGTESPNPDKAMVLGACKVIPQEFPPIICHNIDLQLDSLNNPRVLANLIADILTIPQENAIAYRNNYKWQEIITPFPLTKPQSLPIKQRGTYLIAGDLVEGLGLMYATYLAQEYRANLILIGRKGLPSQSNWQQWLETNQGSPESNLIQQLQTLSNSGTEIIFISTDLDRKSAIASLITEANNKFGQIDGVIHAGTMGDNYTCPLQSLTTSEIAQQFLTKVRGLVTLSDLFTDTKLDFFLLQSSLSSIVGGVGFAAYTAANIFMDTFATMKNKQNNTPWYSINWDGYDSENLSIKNTGLALIDTAINPEEAWKITKRVLSSGIDRVIVSPTDLQPRIDRWIKPKSLIEIDKLQAKTSLSALSNQKKPNVTAKYIAPQNKIEQAVVAAMEELLGINKIGRDDNFFELGGHSLLAIQIVSRLRDEFDVDIPMREFLFESPTAAKIAGVIGSKLEEDTDSDEIEKLLDEVENMSDEEIQNMLKDIQ